MQGAILSLHYLPCISWFRDFMAHSPVLIEKEENFVKSTARNRCEIAGANGKQVLSVPILGGRDHHQKYKQTRIAYQNHWRSSHWQSIRSAYGSAPYFEFYCERFQKFYESEHEFLFDFNHELLKLVLATLKAKKEFSFTQYYNSAVAEMIDLRNRSAEDSMPRYYQVFEERNGFIGDLSILDLIFHLGPQALSYIEKLKG
jgi:hypothetical protein